MVGAGGIAGGRTDAAILLLDQRLVSQLLARRIAPQFGADMLVQPLGERFGETIGERLQQDVRIIVLVGAEAFRMRFEAVEADREAAHPVARRNDKIGKAHIGTVAALLYLLAQDRKSTSLNYSH